MSYVEISSLKPGSKNVDLVVRVLDFRGVKRVRTKRGDRMVGEYVVGDRTGRAMLAAWGSRATMISVGDVLAIHGAWISAFRGFLQINIGFETTVEKLDDSALPMEEVSEDPLIRIGTEERRSPRIRVGDRGSRRAPRTRSRGWGRSR